MYKFDSERTDDAQNVIELARIRLAAARYAGTVDPELSKPILAGVLDLGSSSFSSPDFSYGLLSAPRIGQVSTVGSSVMKPREEIFPSAILPCSPINKFVRLKIHSSERHC